MRICYRLLILSILVPFFSTAQSNYKPGYAVTLKGDTLRGFINYRDWYNNPSAIEFKSFPENKISKLSAKEINYFQVDNIVQYYRYVGRISMDPINVSSVIEERDTTFKVDTVFMQLMIKGKNVALYSYSDRLKTRYYVGETPTYEPKELEYRLYYNMGKANDFTGVGRTVNENTFQKQLFALAVKYNALSDLFIRDIEEADYKEVHIVRAIKMINGPSKNSKHK